ncbi:hypothetical protein WJX82_011099 [Trebouxia sp. C0006]
MLEGKTGSIVIEDMSAATFELIVSYLYRTMNAHLRLDQAVDLIVASDKGEIEELYEYAATTGNERIAEVCRKYLLAASRFVFCLEDMVKLPIKSSSEGEGTSSAPPAAAANTEEPGEQVDDIGDELDADQLDSFWIEELQEARPQLPLPQGSLDVQEAAQQSAILASKHLSSRMAGDPAPSATGHHKHAQVGLDVNLSKGLVDMSDNSSLSSDDSSLSSDNSSLSSDNSSLSSDNSSLSSDNSSLSSDSGRSINQAGELSAILASKDLSSRLAGGPVASARGHHKHAQVNSVGLGVILSKGLVDMSEMDKQPDRAARDSSSDRQPCCELNFLCGRSAAELACHIRSPPSDRLGQKHHMTDDVSDVAGAANLMTITFTSGVQHRLSATMILHH